MKEQVLKNLMVFLSRVDLKGGEVPIFNELLQEVQALPIEKAPTPKKEEEPTSTVKEVPEEK